MGGTAGGSRAEHGLATMGAANGVEYHSILRMQDQTAQRPVKNQLCWPRNRSVCQPVYEMYLPIPQIIIAPYTPGLCPPQITQCRYRLSEAIWPRAISISNLMSQFPLQDEEETPLGP